MAKYIRQTFSFRVTDEQAHVLSDYLYLLNRLRLASGLLETVVVPTEGRYATVQGETYETPEAYYVLRVLYANR